MPNKKINELSVRTPSLNDLMIVGDPSTGYSYKATINALTAFVGGNIQFSTLGGISLTNPSNGQVLQFNGTNWVNATISVPVTSVFGRTGNVVATEGDYSLTQLGDVTLSTPSTNQVLQYNGTAWVNATLTDNGITSLNGLTAVSQTFATGTSGTDFAISSTTSTHTFNLPTASATNRGALSSADWSTFNAKQDAITLTTTGSSGSATLVGATLNIPTYTLAGLGGVSGSGTTNYLSKWTSSSALGNSLVQDDGTNVAIGTTPATYKLNVNGTIYTNNALWMNDGVSASSSYISSPTGFSGRAIRFGNNGFTGNLTIDPTEANARAAIYSTNPIWFRTPVLMFNQTFSVTNSSVTTLFTISPTTGNTVIGGGTQAGFMLDVQGTFRSTADAYFATSSGNVGIGTTSPGNKLQVVTGNVDGIRVQSSGSGYLETGKTGGARYRWANDFNVGDALELQYGAAGATPTTTRMTIFSNGNIQIGSNVDQGYRFFVNGTLSNNGGAAFATTSGNVGIGTTSPTAGYRLDVNGSIYIRNFSAGGLFGGASNSEYIVLATAANAVSGVFQWTNTATYLRGGTSSDLSLGSNNTNDRMIIKSGGNVLINTTTDSGFRLDVNGTARVAQNFYVGSTASNFWSQLRVIQNGQIIIADYSGGSGIDNNIYFDGTNIRYIRTGYASQIQFESDGDIQLSTYPTGTAGNIAGTVVNALIVKNGGSVGIGTTSPGARLDVTASNNEIRSTGTASTYTQYNAFIPSGVNMRIGAFATNNGYLGTTTNHPFTIETNNTQRARFFANGNLLIGSGTTDGGYLVDISGTTRISGSELRLDNGTTGTINLYSATPSIQFFSGDPTGYRLYRSSTTMALSSGGTITLQISGNNGYTLDATNGHQWRTALSGGAALARLDTGGSLSIGNGSTAANASSILDLTSTTKGFLPPRMTNAQMVAIATPASGLMVYDTTNNKLNVYDGTNWVAVH